MCVEHGREEVDNFGACANITVFHNIIIINCNKLFQK